MSSLYPKRSASRNVVHCYLYGKERLYLSSSSSSAGLKKKGRRSKGTLHKCYCCRCHVHLSLSRRAATDHSGISTVGLDSYDFEWAGCVPPLCTAFVSSSMVLYHTTVQYEYCSVTGCPFRGAATKTPECPVHPES